MVLNGRSQLMKKSVGFSAVLGMVVVMGALGNEAKRPKGWVLTEDLGTPPRRTTNELPLSDQDDAAGWLPWAAMSDEFEGQGLDESKWWSKNPRWAGRKPGWFDPANVKIDDGKLHLTMQKAEPPEAMKAKGYQTYTCAAVQSKTRVLYGYFEVKAQPMQSAGSSSFWFYDNTPAIWTEIDAYEIGGGAPGFEKQVNMNVHVFHTPTEKEHWSFHGVWSADQPLADGYHVYGLEWDRQKIRWYFDGVLIRWVENTHWHQSLTLNFDSETMPDWFGLPRDEDLPSTYSIEYIRAWKTQEQVLAETVPELIDEMKTVFAAHPNMIEHTLKVYRHALDIQASEGGDLLTVTAAAILHDIGLPRASEVHGSSAGEYQEIEGPPITRRILKAVHFPADRIEQVCGIIANHHSDEDPVVTETFEFKVVWDADWLVNFPGRYRNTPKEELAGRISETFKTAKGRERAAEMFLKP